MKLITRMRHQTAAQKNEALEHLHREMKRSTKGFYMFVSQMNKLIENAFPDGDVLHIKDAFPDGDVLHIKRITGGIIHGEI